MSYQSLYNKYRPQSFDDVVGQEMVVRVLQAAITKGKVANGYLFEGNRGLGKTTLAKIFAKAVNCLDSDDGDPCNECSSCLAINQNKSMDVVELDAASNRGVDTVREKIINKVGFKPQGKFRVFILDEVHMFTSEAWNALLKTLEEPPSYCVFILCTTNHEKIPKTIISRIQRFNLKDMTNDDIVGRLKYISKCEKISVTTDALYSIARYSNGGMRDSISALDQLCSYYDKITDAVVAEVFGLISDDIVIDILKKIADKNFAECMLSVVSLLESGRSPTDLYDGLVKLTRVLLKISVGLTLEKDKTNNDISSQSYDELLGMKDLFTSQTLLSFLKLFIDNEMVIKRSRDKQASLIIILSGMINGGDSSLSSVVNRLENLERRIEDGGFHAGDAVAIHSTVSNIRKLVYEGDAGDSVLRGDGVVVADQTAVPEESECKDIISQITKWTGGKARA